MSNKKSKATRKRMMSCFAQIVQEHLPGWKIEELAAGEKIRARKFSYSSQAIPADAVAVPAPVLPERDSGRV